MLCSMEANNISPIKMPHISFDMPIAKSIVELEQLRYKRLYGTTIPIVFFQLKSIFHMLESIGSTRIEGNNTTIADYIETTKISSQQQLHFGNKDDITQIENCERAMAYIESNIDNLEINKHFLRELHAITMANLRSDGEGSINIGQFRKGGVTITKSSHIPPDYAQVEPLLDELLEFLHSEDYPQLNLVKIAIAHHRFVWIHPFDNGNGRVDRLLTYALLLKMKIFNKDERIVNPTAIFCSNRSKYYDFLAMADAGTDEGLIAWTEYMLEGLKTEIEKIDKLLDYKYLSANILKPMLSLAYDNKFINDQEYEILVLAINKQTFQAIDIKDLLNVNSTTASRIIKGLLDKNMITPLKEKGRKYTISFNNGLLMRSIVYVLGQNGFLPENLDR